MGNVRRMLYQLCIVLFLLNVFSGCVSGESIVLPIEECYAYSIKNAFYARPSFSNEGSRLEALTTTTEDGTFFCFTSDTSQADDFINAQRTLLHFLRDSGMDVRELRYFATDYDDSFSDSSKNTAYIALSSVRTYQQVLVTLQSLWGDYTDYGYVYAMSNAIAEQLGWQTDIFEAIERTSMDAFFSKNPAAINLLYPSFTEEFASGETVNHSKALSSRIFEEIDWYAALEKPIDVQLDNYYELVGNYAKKIGVSFTRQTCGYANYGEYLPLRILTTYAELIVDKNYSDFYNDTHENYFSDYVSIYQTANIIDEEIIEAVEHFGLEQSAGNITINWLSGDSAEAKHGRQLVNHYNSYLQEVTVTTITGYLHEYYHHIEHLMNPNLGECWQSQAFCEIGRSHSQYAQYVIEKNFTQNEQWTDLFYQCTGRNYQPGVDDYYESYDILCYITNEYELDYLNGRNALNSFSHYLIDLYGEDATYNLMLFPETIGDVTGKTWVELESEWKQHIQNKYAGVEIDLSWLE